MATNVDEKHPLYSERLDDWVQMRDSYRGSRVVKAAGTRYLPATSGMWADGMSNSRAPGRQAYDAYKLRSLFPELIQDAVWLALGVMHRKPAKIALPTGMEFLLESATLRNEGLEVLLRRINEEQLVSGRLGILADVVDTGERAGQPYLALYRAETIINWDDGPRDSVEPQNLSLVVLDESESERVPGAFNWEHKEKYRVLLLGDLDDTELQGEGVYRAGVFRREESGFVIDDMVAPAILGGDLNKIPFVFVNAKDIDPTPDTPPLLGLSELAMAIYRGEADYRQTLFMQGQGTLVVIGALDDTELRVGANAFLRLPAGADAKYVEVGAQGLPEQRQALENSYARAGKKGGDLLDTNTRERESGEALKIRGTTSTASLNRIALTGAFALESELKIVAEWMGENPEDVSIEPNLDFVGDELAGKTLVELMSAKTLGAPISKRTIHQLMQDKDLTDMEFEDEEAEIEQEKPLPTPSMDPNGPQPDDEEDDDDAEQEEEETAA